MRGLGRFRTRCSRLLATLLLAAFALGAAAAHASTMPPPEPVPVHVTFTGTGTFTLRNTFGADDSVEDQFNWLLEFQSTLQVDGTLVPAQTTPPTSAGNYHFENTFFNVNCSGDIPTQPRPLLPDDPNPPPGITPAPKVEGTLVEGITYLSDNAEDPSFARCLGEKEYEGQGEAAGIVGGVLNNFLPGAMTARIVPVPLQALIAGGLAERTENVSDSGAPEHVPSSCSYLFGIEDPNQCTMSLTWSGVVILDATTGCPVILAGPPAACLPLGGVPAGTFTAGVETSASGPGTASITAAAAGSSHASAARRTIVASAKLRVARAGRVRLHPRLTAAGRRLLGRTHHLPVVVTLSFAPRSGPAHSTHFTTVLRSR